MIPFFLLLSRWVHKEEKDMPRFIASNVIAGKLTWARVESSRIYSVYKDDAMKELNKRGYTIDRKGNCVPLEK